MERIEREPLGLFCLYFADVLVGCEDLERLESPGEVVGAYEVSEMASKLAGLIVEALDGRLLERPVYALDLAVGPWMFGLGEAMIDIVLRASEFEGVSAEDLVPLEHSLDLGGSAAIATGLGEVRAIFGQDSVNFAGNGFDRGSEEVCNDPLLRIPVH